MARRPRIAIVGPGRWGSALALALKREGYSITEVISRPAAASQRKARELARKLGAMATTRVNATLDSDIVWFCVADREIANAGRELGARANWKGKIALHSSGALASDELGSLRRSGASVASVHPLMTFVQGSKPSLKKVPFALEGDPVALRRARQVVRDLGGESFLIPKRNKAAYHAWGAFTSPLLVALLVTGEQIAKSAGISPPKARKMMSPIVAQTLTNYAALGPAGAFSGPLVRGDVAVVDQHLRALRDVPGARDVYLALGRAALRHLPVRGQKALRKALTGTTARK